MEILRETRRDATVIRGYKGIMQGMELHGYSRASHMAGRVSSFAPVGVIGQGPKEARRPNAFGVPCSRVGKMLKEYDEGE